MVSGQAQWYKAGGQGTGSSMQAFLSLQWISNLAEEG